MLKKTIQLLIKALIIGALISISLQRVPAHSLPTVNEKRTEQQPLQPSPVDSEVGLLEGKGD